MSYSLTICATGLANEVLLDALSASGGLSISSNRIACDCTANGNNCLIKVEVASGWITTGRLAAFSGYVSTSSISPSEDVSVLRVDTARKSSSTGRILRLGTDGKLKVYTPSGTLLGSSAGAISTTAASPTEFCFVMDFISSPTVWVALAVGGTWDLNYTDTGVATATWIALTTSYMAGELLDAGSNPGITMTLSNLVTRFTTSSSDAPYITAYPRLNVLGGMNLPPTAEASFNWASAAGDASPNTWKNIGATHDAGNNDGNTTNIGDNQIGDTPAKVAHTALYTYSAANPLPGGSTVVGIQMKHDQALSLGGKDGANCLIKLSGTEATAAVADNSLSTNYAGEGYRYNTRPDGSPWAATDFDLSAGVSQLQFGARSIVVVGIDTGPAITKMCGPEIVHYTASEPLAQMPAPVAMLHFDRRQLVATARKTVPAVSVPFMGLFTQVVTPVVTTSRSWVQIT